MCSDKKKINSIVVKGIVGSEEKGWICVSNFNLFPHMSVMENIIEAPIYVLKMDEEKAEEKAKDLLKV